MQWDESQNFWIISDFEEDHILRLAREQEWAEAYADEYPDCELGAFYLTLIRRELQDAEAFG